VLTANTYLTFALLSELCCRHRLEILDLSPVDLPDTLAVTPRKVVIDSHHMNSFAGKGIEIRGENLMRCRGGSEMRHNVGED